MLARKSEDWDNLGTARCGRCAQILPDETITYCPSCGVPFSRVPPTASFQLLSERTGSRLFSWGFKGLGSLAGVGFFLWGLSALFLELRNQAFLSELKTLRPVQVFYYERPEYPQNGRALVEASVAVAKQAFKDHFGFELQEVNLKLQQDLPSSLRFVGQDSWNFSFGSLAFWTHFSNEKYTQKFFQNPHQDLEVLFSNFPIFADRRISKTMELRHLSSESAISGLSHPGLILVSSYRMNNHKETFDREGVTIESFEDKARFLGEYVLAHELGHSLLGLEDAIFRKPGPQSDLRSPASVSEHPYKECLMHSDEGGGFWALKQLKARPLGRPSVCQVYSPIVQAFSKRTEAFQLLRKGKRRQGFELHQEAMRLVDGKTQTWVKKVWQKEAMFFDSSFRRWIRGIFMFE